MFFKNPVGKNDRNFLKSIESGSTYITKKLNKKFLDPVPCNFQLFCCTVQSQTVKFKMASILSLTLELKHLKTNLNATKMT